MKGEQQPYRPKAPPLPALDWLKETKEPRFVNPFATVTQEHETAVRITLRSIHVDLTTGGCTLKCDVGIPGTGTIEMTRLLHVTPEILSQLQQTCFTHVQRSL